ncbi:hypothetical protein SAMN05428981_10140 [Bacillus sp. OV194]|nr:hypothetical protein SAMN05428981_10140 [Bacillus sp. OV194]
MKVLGYCIFFIGLWMMISPQAVLGLQELKWMANYAFPGEALIGAFICAASLLLFNPSKSQTEQ